MTNHIHLLNTELELAFNNFDYTKAKILIDNSNIHINDSIFIENKLTFAYQHDILSHLEFLYTLGFDFNKPFYYKKELSHIAYADSMGYFQSVKKLIELGVIYDFDPTTRLRDSVVKTNYKGICSLYEMGAKLNSKTLDNKKNTVLHEAIRIGEINNIKALAYHHYSEYKDCKYQFCYLQKLPKKTSLLNDQTIYVYTNSKNKLVYSLKTTHNFVQNKPLLFNSQDIQSDNSKEQIYNQIVNEGHIHKIHNRFFNSEAASIKNNAGKTPLTYLKTKPKLLLALFNDQVEQLKNDSIYYVTHSLYSQSAKFTVKSKQDQDLKMGLNILYHPVLPKEIKHIIWHFARFSKPNAYTPSYTLKSDRQAKEYANATVKSRFGLEECLDIEFLTQDFSKKLSIK